GKIGISRPSTDFMPRATISPLRAYSRSCDPCVSSANGIDSATAITEGRVYGLNSTKPSSRATAYPHAAAAESSGIGEGVLDRLHSPPFLVEHAIVDDAADRQLAVLLDRVVLQVLVAAVAVHQ